ncbi:Branched-chain amino acid ABC transporter amino acid-binding protein [Paramagnetospirillum magnetotacticum MS-1]|uniref:Branched-chain amino acid ABC transporter amino acid-binding protein n=1 Tax=Paramagnetospirillum magnetotacticum MS-1 TaxID=272627 RepID=A0A0C2YLH3_PARME|nr:ABC transporter substrate-binding protein [Paramagnetospirillum magnetotacticum]KIM00620.1 Branched-chain amino acid ABC transporter amino acid-binding protein [Paramagnetospirillum magnetotacticum MS-1]
MRRILAAFIALAALAPFAALALPVTTGVSNPTIVVAVIATLSGPGAMAGQDSVDGFTTAMRHLGGRFANQEVRVVVQDDKGSPDTALAVARRMIEREKVDFVVTAVSLPSMSAMVKTLTESRAFVLNLDAAPATMGGAACSPWFFQVATPVQAVYDAIGAHLTAEKMRRVMIIGTDSPATDQAVASIRRAWQGEVIEVLRPRHGTTRFADEAAAIRQASPDAVVNLLTGGMGTAFAREYAAAGLKADIAQIGVWQGWERPMLPAMTEAGMDVLNVAPWSPDLETPLGKRLITDFELEYGRPVTGWVAQGYDTAQMLDAALRATGGRAGDRDAVRNALRRAEFSSVRGAFRFDTNHSPSVNVYLRRTTRDTKGRPAEELRTTLIKDWHSRDIALCPMRWVEEPAPGHAPGTTPPKPGTPAQPAKPKPPAPGLTVKPKPPTATQN